MQKIYREIMEKQHMSQEGKAAFYVKLEKEQIPSRKATRILRLATVAACLCLCLVGIVAATELALGKSVIELFTGDTKTEYGYSGFEVSFEGVKDYPLSAFSQTAQAIQEQTVIGYKTIGEMETAVGVSLCPNQKLSSMIPNHSYAIDGVEKQGRCQAVYHARDGQLSDVFMRANYRIEGHLVGIGAHITVEHPAWDCEESIDRHFNGRFHKEDSVLRSETYVGKNGLAASFVIAEVSGKYNWYTAYYVIDDIVYTMDVTAGEGRPQEEILDIFKAILDGYEI